MEFWALDQDTDHLKYLFVYISIILAATLRSGYWSFKIYFFIYLILLSLRKVQSSLGFFLTFHLRESWWGGNYQSFSSQLVWRLSLPPFFHFILLLGFLPFGGILDFLRGAFLVFPMQELSPIQFACAFSPRAARPRKVWVKTRNMKRGPFLVICVWQGLAGSPFFSGWVSLYISFLWGSPKEGPLFSTFL